MVINHNKIKGAYCFSLVPTIPAHRCLTAHFTFVIIALYFKTDFLKNRPVLYGFSHDWLVKILCKNLQVHWTQCISYIYKNKSIFALLNL